MHQPTEEELRAQARSDGMTTLWEDAVAKARAGRTSLEEAVRVLGGPG